MLRTCFVVGGGGVDCRLVIPWSKEIDSRF